MVRPATTTTTNASVGSQSWLSSLLLLAITIISTGDQIFDRSCSIRAGVHVAGVDSGGAEEVGQAAGADVPSPRLQVPFRVAAFVRKGQAPEVNVEAMLPPARCDSLEQGAEGLGARRQVVGDEPAAGCTECGDLVQHAILRVGGKIADHQSLKHPRSGRSRIKTCLSQCFWPVMAQIGMHCAQFRLG